MLNNGDEGMDDVDYTELAVRDVAEVLRGQYAVITGGKTREGCPILTFPDLGNFSLLGDEDFQRLMLYLTSVPSMQEADVGFVLVIDRRTDKWNSVKTVLLKISGSFPGLIHVAYVLRPAGFLQKAISEVSNKLFKDEFKFKVVVCNCVEELHEFIDTNQLTADLSGTLPYNHEEWIQQRVALEKFSTNTHEVSAQLHDFTQRLQEAGFPNDVTSTKELLLGQEEEYGELKENILNAAKHGEQLLADIRQANAPTSDGGDQSCPDRITNVSAVERLLVQLEETERTFDDFWQTHSTKLNQCLELRQFEYDFRELQGKFDNHLTAINDMTEIGESVARVDTLIKEADEFERKCLIDLERADELQGVGTQLMSSRHYGVDSIRPKCVELCRMAQTLGERLQHRLALLAKCRVLQERVEKANKWCAQGIELIASQPLEKCSNPTIAEQSLSELESFVQAGTEMGIGNSKDLRSSFKDVIAPETRALVQQVVTRVEDVHLMCERRHASLKQMTVKPSPKPIQQVQPEPAAPLNAPYSSGSSDDCNQQQLSSPANKANSRRRANRMELPSDANTTIAPSAGGQRTGEWPDSSSPDSEASSHDHEALRAKRGHVLAELLDTERIYVTELSSILKGYRDELISADEQGSLPLQLHGKADVLFGNLDELHRFHSDIFLRDLDNCITAPELIGLCFVHRRDSFHRLYSAYCQNIPRSEALRQAAGEQQCAFFKDCQMRLGHKLPLGAYLLKPVQRITKYQLLLKDLLRYSEDQPGSCKQLQDALDCMLVVLKCVNDSMHQVAITGFWGNLTEQGELLMQGQFNVWVENKKDRLRELRLKPMQRQIFLYEKSVLLCKRVGRDPETATYHFKTFLQMSQVGLTENIRGSKGDQRKLELWLQGRQEVYILQAPTLQQKEGFVKHIKRVLLSQLEQLKGESQKRLQRGMTCLNQTIMSPHRPLRQTASWDSQNVVVQNVPSIVQSNNNGVAGRRRGSRHGSSDTSATLGVGGGEAEDDEGGWSSDYSNSDEEDSATDPFGSEPAENACRKFTALADYCAMGSSEVNMHEGDTVELLKVGCAGWWFVKVNGTQQEGWAPKAYLEVVNKKMNHHSSPSVSSQDSGMGTNGGKQT